MKPFPAQAMASVRNFKKRNAPDNSLLLCITLCPSSKMTLKVLASKPIRIVYNHGRAIWARYATVTDAWHREELQPATLEDFCLSLENAPKKAIPHYSKTVIML